MNPRFVRLLHRALDVAAAREFYQAVLGDAALEIVPVPEAAASRGAPAHWLGAIGVDDVPQTLEQLLARGATLVGPVQTHPDGAFATVRDAGGALLALTSQTTAPVRLAVAWCHLDAQRAEASFDVYTALFGWQAQGDLDLGSAGVMTQFAWEPGGPPVGSFADVATRPGIHPHWQFHFQVDALDAAISAVRERRGIVLADTRLPDGTRVAVCDDPHGGGFALCGAER